MVQLGTGPTCSVYTYESRMGMRISKHMYSGPAHTRVQKWSRMRSSPYILSLDTDT